MCVHVCACACVCTGDKNEKEMSEIWHIPLMLLMSGAKHTALSTVPLPGVNKRGGVMGWQYWLG